MAESASSFVVREYVPEKGHDFSSAVLVIVWEQKIRCIIYLAIQSQVKEMPSDYSNAIKVGISKKLNNWQIFFSVRIIWSKMLFLALALKLCFSGVFQRAPQLLQVPTRFCLQDTGGLCFMLLPCCSYVSLSVW